MEKRKKERKKERCRLAGITVQKEVTVKLTDGTTYRADIVLPTGLPGYTSLPVLLDVTFRSPFTKTAIKKACRWSGAASVMSEGDKDRILSESLSDSKYEFIPLESRPSVELDPNAPHLQSSSSLNSTTASASPTTRLPRSSGNLFPSSCNE